ncbi:restriction endonuclease subunit S [Dellaglioa algida]|uniref:restriction endonuclease subunit S n=1 Tax=Dellaglioa algida TaxID=105612 RepID=UPI0024C4C177|nr:restriction endonuclease subunit S [Dellaglioa algida]MDK1723199.1 restriction endonuclease subunit S [Dellaglioa algida]
MSSFNCVTKRYDLNTDWEQRKLGEVTERITRKNKNLESTLPLTISARDGLVDQNAFFNKQVASKDISNYYLLRNGEFAYNKSYSKDYPWGAIKRLENYEMGVLSTLYIVFQTQNINSDFLVTYYDTNKWHKEISVRAAEGARNHGLLNIAPVDFFETVLKIPNDFEEQNLIGLFLKKLDNTIALHLFKLETLKKLKQGYLQVVFPENKYSIPYLRFANFSAPWEQRKLGDLGSVAMNKRIFKEQTSEFGDIPFFKIGTFGGNPDAFISRKLYDEYKTKYAYPKIGDILISASGSIGKMVEYQGKDEYFQDSNIIWFKHDNRINNKFLKQFYLIVKWQGLEGSTIKRLYNRNVLSTIINIPSSLEEQKIVSTFLERLDNTIALHQAKIEKLQRIKKSYLQKMFI